MRIGNGGSFKQLSALLSLAIELLMTHHRMKKVLSSGILAAVFHPAANLSPSNLARVRQALGLGTVSKLECGHAGPLQDANVFVRMIEKEGGIVTDKVKELISEGQLVLSDDLKRYRAWVVRVENLSGTTIQASAMNMGLTCPPAEIGLLMRTAYSQGEIGPNEVIIPCKQMTLEKDGVRQDYLLRLFIDDQGRNVLDGYPLDMHRDTSFKPDQHFIFVNPYESWANLPDPQEE